VDGYLVASRETKVGAIRLTADDAGIVGIVADSRTCTGSGIGRNGRGRSQSRKSDGKGIGKTHCERCL
jgi:hypothetical protein